MNKKPPLYDDCGINLADPHDRLGLKTEYISKLQIMALSEYLKLQSGLAIDIGCGYGRMTRRLANLGFEVKGMDPSLRVLQYASSSCSEIDWFVGSLPNIPCPDGTFKTVFLLNVLRSLHLLGIKDVSSGIGRIIESGGYLAIIDNLRYRHPNYLEEDWLVEEFRKQGLTLEVRVPIRSSRWFMIYLIRSGIIPIKWFDFIAHWELRRMRHRSFIPRFSYYNVLWIFKKT